MDRREDLFGIGGIGLSKGTKTFDKTKNTKKSTYLCRCIENEIFTELRKENAQKRAIETISINEENIIDDSINIEDDLIKQQEYCELYRQVFKLPIYEQYVIYQTFFKNRTQQEILERFNRIHDEKYTQPDISKLKNKGLKLLEERLKG